MDGRIRVGSIAGIPFFLHPSWFFVLVLVTLSNGSSLGYQYRELGDTLPLLLGFVTALLLFLSVLLHELGHSLVALRQGIPVNSITLFLFGGIASLGRESNTPGEAFQVAIAGPLVSLMIFAGLTGLDQVLGLSGPAQSILELITTINFVIAIFNLIPGLPLDGGAILKSLVWRVTQNPAKGTIIAGRTGQIFGWIGILTGVIPMLVLGTFSTVWNALIGWFLIRNAGQAIRNAQLEDRLSQMTAAEAIFPNSPIVSEQLTLREFANQYVIGQAEWKQYLVVNEQNQWIGILLVDDLKLIPTDLWPQAFVKDLMQPSDLTQRVAAQQSLLEVVKQLEQTRVTELPVVDADQTLIGLLGKTSIRRSLEQPAPTLSSETS